MDSNGDHHVDVDEMVASFALSEEVCMGMLAAGGLTHKAGEGLTFEEFVMVMSHKDAPLNAA